MVAPVPGPSALQPGPRATSAERHPIRTACLALVVLTGVGIGLGEAIGAVLVLVVDLLLGVVGSSP